MTRMRSAYEKVVPVGKRTRRRGRQPGVPVELYHELDEISRRLDGLTVLTGANSESIAAALDPAKAVGAASAVGTEAPAAFTLRVPVSLGPSSAGTSVATAFTSINGYFSIARVEFAIDSGPALVSAIPHVDYISGTSAAFIDVLTPGINSQSLNFSDSVPRVFPAYSIDGQPFPDIPRRFAPGQLRLRATSALSIQVYGTIVIDLEIQNG